MVAQSPGFAAMGDWRTLSITENAVDKVSRIQQTPREFSEVIPMNARSFFIVSAATAALFSLGCEKGPKTGEEPTSAKVAPAAAKPASAKATTVEGKTYGAGVKMETTVSIEELLANPDAYKGKTVRVAGMVTDVCPKRGCWFDMAGEKPGQKLRFKVTDGEMVFPMDSKGKHAIGEGVVNVRELSLEETKKYEAYQAEEMGKEFDPASVTEAKKIVRIDGVGAVIGDKK